MGNIQVASLTITSEDAVSGQEIRIANSVYTIVTNFSNALSVIVPIYTWGDYTVSTDGHTSKSISITSSNTKYSMRLMKPAILYDNGVNNGLVENPNFMATYISMPMDVYGGNSVYTDIVVNLSKYTTFKIDSTSRELTSFNLELKRRDGTSLKKTNYISDRNQRQMLSLDISSITSECELEIKLTKGNTGLGCLIHKIWFE